ncbi:r2r3-MYB transcription factor [Tritrichomonas foetus]|uniref:R2r3-MYB transcription factor n=1 Tax=Tritrichomonas foetus TaxID=1144522 RepID=A0A1J4KXG6_9EUKA|nr:r2r3-MYB transcription factor [Tritrichomonas foetus]|eukprot:OHT14396.1 r2r3-MYB transcription factor [Tritrichomonas foetus]
MNRFSLSHQADPMRKKRKARNKFTENEDIKLVQLVTKYGDNNWVLIAEKLNGRSPRQCRDRYVYYLDPSIKKGEWTKEEERILLEKYYLLGSSWKLIANFLPGRTEIDLKNRFLKINRAIKKSERKKLKEIEKLRFSHLMIKKKKQKGDALNNDEPANSNSSNGDAKSIIDNVRDVVANHSEVLTEGAITNDFFIHEDTFQEDSINWFSF